MTTSNETNSEFAEARVHSFIELYRSLPIASFELSDSISFRITSHIKNKILGIMQAESDQRRYLLLMAMAHVKEFKQLWSTFHNLNHLVEGDMQYLYEISKLDVAVPERVDMLIATLGNVHTKHGVMEVMWPMTTAKTCLANALKYGCYYFEEQVFSKHLPDFSKGYCSQLIWKDDEGYNKYQHYCDRYLNAHADLSKKGYKAMFTEEYTCVYEAYLVPKEQWMTKMDEYDGNDIVIKTLKVLGLELCSLHASTLQTMATRVCHVYERYEKDNFRIPLYVTKGRKTGWIGQLCVVTPNKTINFAFDCTGSDRTIGYILKPCIYYEINDNTKANKLFSKTGTEQYEESILEGS
ncbi:uncharacterized protein J8A68_002195 [[Candida] subhashii]|uniref:Uncharacterized protein n=1 Tax=[Candida] subhashii TaxID=561895 RepID=A0A8J5UYF7_9ASCO|nr:uncharacterized protein J8A68_002195 [[Candida] subhashii]KAG7664280.1 hypothetical protein J8A68_002195 [[Candida] subhashii]